jgi:hypothetical protein
MSTIIVNHKVKDYAKWRPIYDADDKRRQTYGFKNARVYRAADDPNNIFIVADITDASQVLKMKDDPDLAAKMAEGGVISEPTISVLNPT